MKKFTLKTLLVAAGLLMGGSAWADNEVYDFRNFIGGLTNNATLVKGNSVTVGESTMYLMDNFTTANYSTQRYPARDFNTNGRFAVGNESWQLRRKADAGYMIRPSSGAGTLSILNLNEGDKIIFDFTISENSDDNTNDGSITITSANSKIENDAAVSSGTSIVDGIVYEMTANGHLDIAVAQYVGFRCITIIPNPDVEVVSVPNIAAVAANNGQRTVAITGGSTTKDGASIASYRYTLDGSAPSASVGTVYDAEAKIVISETKTIKAVAISSTGKASSVQTQEIVAGTTIQLATPTAALTNMALSGGVYYPVYTFTSNNSSKIGAPSATLKYTFTPTTGDPQSGTLSNGVFTFTEYGTVSVTAEASGYGNSENSDQSVDKMYEVQKTYDFSDNNVTTNLINTTIWSETVANNAFLNQSGKKATAYHVPENTNGAEMIEGLTFDATQGNDKIYITTGYGMDYHYGRGSFTVAPALETGEIAIYTKVNTSNVETTVSGANTTISRYSDGTGLKNIIIFSPLPATVSAPITSSTGYATFSSTYALDFTDVTALTAYTATAYNGEWVTLTKVTGTVAANTGLIIKGETADIPVVATGDAQAGNMLFALDGSYSELGAGTGGTNYVLSVQDDEAVFAPIESDAAPVAAGHAALFVPDAQGGAKLRFVFADDASGIKNIATEAIENSAIYNLSGQRVNAAYKGIVIKNGKKYLNK